MSKKFDINYGSDEKHHFKMISVSSKRPTYRYAIAYGEIVMHEEAFKAVKEQSLPKGDCIAMAEVTAITGAKNTPNNIPMCHSVPLDQVTSHFILNEKKCSVEVYCQVLAYAKTGVEMEALSGVNSALLTLWDLIKGTDPNLCISNVKLLVKSGGKKGLWINKEGIPSWLKSQLPDKNLLSEISTAVLVISDRASEGKYKDVSGETLCNLIKKEEGNLLQYKLIPDDINKIKDSILNICKIHKPDLLITSGGTGPGPRDVTPEVIEDISDRILSGLGNILVNESSYFTQTAWLSRMTAAMIDETLIVTLPGSPKAVKECWEIISPFIARAINRIKQQGFKAKK